MIMMFSFDDNDVDFDDNAVDVDDNDVYFDDNDVDLQCIGVQDGCIVRPHRTLR